MYTHCTLQDDKVYWWYNVLDHQGDHHKDYDVLEWYVIEKHDTWAFMLEYTPVGRVFWAYSTLDEALQVVCEHVNWYEQLHKKVEEAKKKLEEAKKKFAFKSLDEAYANHTFTEKPKVKKETPVSKYLDRLRTRTEEMHARVEQARAERNWKLWKQEYIYALINH